ncbi:MAG: isocitrate dehydrogenase (NADP(+)) [Deltaproteobacteria bacterium]|nr:isocitrate dehydrogenase (NADP(+)) [Deltaproteobacteria bacterium]MBW2120915.1 isocitrate dehydrogenase (NADP(+)) [Deltaproteobacteria bacterium]
MKYSPEGHPIETDHAGRILTPDDPVIPFIEGDGVGPDIWKASVRVFDAAVRRVYGERRRVVWLEVLAGRKAFDRVGTWLPDETVETIRHYGIGIKGPLTTPVGKGFRSLNVSIRRILDLYACVRPIRYIPGVPSPVKNPERVDMVVFRENTEDVYAGVEWKAGTREAGRVIDFLNRTMGERIRAESGIGIKPVSAFCSKRLVRRAIAYAVETGRPRVTLVHKGNIMKYTEGAFRDWGYEVAAEEFPQVTVTEEEAMTRFGGDCPAGRILVNDRIADSMFQQVLLRPEDYSVLATTNLNGDYLSDALAAQVGGIGMAPGSNLGDGIAVFEATHGTAPKYAGRDMVNPGSLILSGGMMFEYLGWTEVSRTIERALAKTVEDGFVTYDLARQMEGARQVKCSEFADRIMENME